MSESGAEVGADSKVWTGTNVDGSRAGADCNSWASATGFSARTGLQRFWVGGFTSVNDIDCSLSFHLYCFGVDKTTELALPPRDPNAAVAFVSTQNWSPTTGIPVADNFCMQDAAAAELAGTYRAAIAPAGSSVVSRFPAPTTYVRADGVSIGFALTTTQPDTFLNVTATGTVSPSRVWTGGLPGAISALPTLDNCGDWNAPTTQGIFGDSNSGDTSAFNTTRQSCLEALPVYCFPM